jgi:HTH-type transcriptional regulator / antitoxin HigA
METIRPIKSEEQYREALKKVDALIDAKPNSPEFELLEVISILIDDYENKHHAIELLDPIEAIKYEMEEKGLKQKDLVKYFGSKEMVSQVLNKKRPLSLKMIKNLYQNFGISADVLLA